ncbi:MAG: lysozyme [Acidimicrobiales bacterium]|nr:lysozyme [Acidimicrobiales bacterium]
MAPALKGPELSSAGLAFIARFEGFRENLYNDPLGHCTIGYGHLVHRGRCNGTEPAEFRNGISEVQARKLLKQDAARFEESVSQAVTVPLLQHQFDALVSFTYNVGAGGLGRSTLLKRLNRNERDAVPSELMKWTNGGLQGLVRRRKAEGRIWTHKDYAG